MNIILITIGLLILVFLIGNIKSKQNSKSKIKLLYSSSGSPSDKVFHYEQLKRLPPIVQRYFKHVLKDGQAYVNNVFIEHDGYFKTSKNKKWSKIKGKQYFITQKPGFIWEGKIGVISAKDMYLNDEGSLTIKLFNLLKLAEEKGEQINQGELLRWLGESVWFPTNLLPSENLRWVSIDDKSAKLLFNYKEFKLQYIVTFNDNYEIVKLETERYMDKKSKKPWIGECTNYQEVYGIRIPFNIKATWKLDDGDYNYVDFNIKKIEYNFPL